ncbi:acetyltransferase [Vibrio cholerae]|nr:acetyltransferase [Vibrio cholerae]TQP57017.1 acetyltransferase [Vibrio cholerae]
MVAVVVFEFSGMRCQPLRRALCALEEVWNNLIVLSVI